MAVYSCMILHGMWPQIIRQMCMLQDSGHRALMTPSAGICAVQWTSLLAVDEGVVLCHGGPFP